MFGRGIKLQTLFPIPLPIIPLPDEFFPVKRRTENLAGNFGNPSPQKPLGQNRPGQIKCLEIRAATAFTEESAGLNTIKWPRKGTKSATRRAATKGKMYKAGGKAKRQGKDWQNKSQIPFPTDEPGLGRAGLGVRRLGAVRRPIAWRGLAGEAGGVNFGGHNRGKRLALGCWSGHCARMTAMRIQYMNNQLHISCFQAV
jgi:hypothetical protein